MTDEELRDLSGALDQIVRLGEQLAEATREIACWKQTSDANAHDANVAERRVRELTEERDRYLEQLRARDGELLTMGERLRRAEQRIEELERSR